MDSIVRVHTSALRAAFTWALLVIATGLAGCSKADDTAKAANTAAATSAYSTKNNTQTRM